MKLCLLFFFLRPPRWRFFLGLAASFGWAEDDARVEAFCVLPSAADADPVGLAIDSGPETRAIWSREVDAIALNCAS